MHTLLYRVRVQLLKIKKLPTFTHEYVAWGCDCATLPVPGFRCELRPCTLSARSRATVRRATTTRVTSSTASRWHSSPSSTTPAPWSDRSVLPTPELYPHPQGCSPTPGAVPPPPWLYPHPQGCSPTPRAVPTPPWLYPHPHGCTHTPGAVAPPLGMYPHCQVGTPTPGLRQVDTLTPGTTLTPGPPSPPWAQPDVGYRKMPK